MMCDKIIENLIADAEDYDAETIRNGCDPADIPHEIEVLDGHFDWQWRIRNTLTQAELAVSHWGDIELQHKGRTISVEDSEGEALLNWGKCNMGMALRVFVDDMVREQAEATDWQDEDDEHGRRLDADRRND